MGMVENARMFAIGAHRAINHRRRYTGEPYDVHLKNVADGVDMMMGGPHMIAAAWLHDVLEDTMVTEADLRELFPRPVVDLVVELTHVTKSGDGSRAWRMGIERHRLSKSSADAQTIKCMDLMDNTRSIGKHDHGFAKVYFVEKADTLNVLTKASMSAHQEAWDHLEAYASHLGIELPQRLPYGGAKA